MFIRYLLKEEERIGRIKGVFRVWAGCCDRAERAFGRGWRVVRSLEQIL